MKYEFREGPYGRVTLESTGEETYGLHEVDSYLVHAAFMAASCIEYSYRIKGSSMIFSANMDEIDLGITTSFDCEAGRYSTFFYVYDL